MGVPTRTLASMVGIRRLPAFFTINDTDANPVFYVLDGNGVPSAVGINLDAFLDANGKVNMTNAIAALSVTNAMLAGSITGSKLVSGVVNVNWLAGVDETAADVTLAAMAVGDEINAVLVFTSAASIATGAIRAAGDFVPGAGKMVSTANKANNTGNEYLVVWTKHT